MLLSFLSFPLPSLLSTGADRLPLNSVCESVLFPTAFQEERLADASFLVCGLASCSPSVFLTLDSCCHEHPSHKKRLLRHTGQGPCCYQRHLQSPVHPDLWLQNISASSSLHHFAPPCV